jgi:hypothetical protein
VSQIINYVVFDGEVCVTTNRRRINAENLWKRLVARYGPGCAERPGAACFTVRLTQEQVQAVLTSQELAPPPLVEIPDERLCTLDWGDMPRWAKSYIEELERLLGIDPRTM